jgi:hypothetical protein
MGCLNSATLHLSSLCHGPVFFFPHVALTLSACPSDLFIFLFPVRTGSAIHGRSALCCYRLHDRLQRESPETICLLQPPCFKALYLSLLKGRNTTERNTLVQGSPTLFLESYPPVGFHSFPVLTNRLSVSTS